MWGAVFYCLRSFLFFCTPPAVNKANSSIYHLPFFYITCSQQNQFFYMPPAFFIPPAVNKANSSICHLPFFYITCSQQGQFSYKPPAINKANSSICHLPFFYITCSQQGQFFYIPPAVNKAIFPFLCILSVHFLYIFSFSIHHLQSTRPLLLYNLPLFLYHL